MERGKKFNMHDSEAKVDQLIERYTVYYNVHPLLVNLIDDHDLWTLINSAIGHECCVLEQRSKNLADHELTIFQKAFLELSRSDNKNPAVALWVEEILGINAALSYHTAAIVKAAAVSRAAILAKHHEYQECVVINDSEDSLYEHVDMASPNVSSQPKDNSVPLGEASFAGDEMTIRNGPPHNAMPSIATSDPALDHIMRTYQNAVLDYVGTPQKSLARTQAAKFLRDTIENCLSYVAANDDANNIYAGDWGPVLRAMEMKLPDFKKTAEKGCGGKKRAFEDPNLAFRKRSKAHFETRSFIGEYDTERSREYTRSRHTYHQNEHPNGWYRTSTEDVHTRSKPSKYHTSKTNLDCHLSYTNKKRAFHVPRDDFDDHLQPSRLPLAHKDTNARAPRSCGRGDWKPSFHGDCYRPHY